MLHVFLQSRKEVNGRKYVDKQGIDYNTVKRSEVLKKGRGLIAGTRKEGIVAKKEKDEHEPTVRHGVICYKIHDQLASTSPLH